MCVKFGSSQCICVKNWTSLAYLGKQLPKGFAQIKFNSPRLHAYIWNFWNFKSPIKVSRFEINWCASKIRSPRASRRVLTYTLVFLKFGAKRDTETDVMNLSIPRFEKQLQHWCSSSTLDAVCFPCWCCNSVQVLPVSDYYQLFFIQDKEISSNWHCSNDIVNWPINLLVWGYNSLTDPGGVHGTLLRVPNPLVWHTNL